MKKTIILFAAAALVAACTPKVKTYDSYEGLVMCGYQGWHDCEGDGADRDWGHYVPDHGYFGPEHCKIDVWPETSEYEKLYETGFKYADGTTAYIQSPYDYSTVDTHFRWMQEYGIDGVFMQRFIGYTSNPKLNNHFNTILSHAKTAANKYQRAYAVMYDLSGYHEGHDQYLLDDIMKLADEHQMFDHKANPSYLYENGKPLVCVWGVGFTDREGYGIDEAFSIVNGLKERGFSVMLGVPTYWREMKKDTRNDPRFHELLSQCDVIMPWFVGRYNNETFDSFKGNIKDDIKWAEEHNIGYAPLCYPGFSWDNLNPGANSLIPRRGGEFFKRQLDWSIECGAKMIYVAMFDEVDEGTAIFKIARKIPVTDTRIKFVPLDDEADSDTWLKLAGEAAAKLKK